MIYYDSKIYLQKPQSAVKIDSALHKNEKIYVSCSNI